MMGRTEGSEQGTDRVNAADKMTQSVAQFLREHAQPPGQVAFVVAVSGGVDSMVLLHLAAQFARTAGVGLVAAHVNHGLRAQADADARFVETVCHAWEIPVAVKRIELTTIPAANRQGTEADARTLRYDALQSVAAAYRCEQVLLGHHADDQAETVLWRMLRGTSLTGLGGMRAVTRRAGLQWLRPLLAVDRRAILGYAARHNISFVEDETNATSDYLRNYLRHEVMPRIHHVQPGFTSTVQRLTQVIQAEDTWMEVQATEFVQSVSTREQNVYRIDVELFRQAPIPLQRRGIKIILYCLASGDWSFAHVEAVMRLLDSVRPSSYIHLGSDLTAWREYHHLLIGPGHGAQYHAYSVVWELAEGARLTAGSWHHDTHWSFAARTWSRTDGVRTEDLYELRLPHLAEVVVRTVDTAERVSLPGGRGHRKVQDVFTDRKVPQAQRSRWPAVCVGDEIVWLPGVFRSGHAWLQPTDDSGWVITGWPAAQPLSDAQFDH